MTEYITDTIDVEATVTNTGTVDGTTTVTLDADGSQVALRSPVAVAAGGSETLVLPWDSSGASTGSHSLTAATTTDSASTTVDLQAAASITIDSVSPSNPDPGETTDVAATLTNQTTDRRGLFLELVVDGTVEDSLEVILGGGQSASGPVLSWTPSSAGNKTVEVRAAVASDSTTVTVGSVATVPSSAIHRWKLDDVGTGTATDSIGSADGTVNGVSSVSGTYQGGSAGDGDGTDDYIDTTTLGSFGSGLNSGGAIGLTVKFTDTSSFLAPLGSLGADDFEGVSVYANGFASSNGRLELQLRDDTGDDVVVTTTTGVADGNKHRVLFNINDPSANDVDVHTDSVAGTNTVRAKSPTMGDLAETMLIFARNRASGEDGYWPGVVDDVIFYDSTLSTAEIQDDYNIQPWS